ncbi:helix-turn-helix transcriptional regulator [Chitinimonas sp.]|uniref:helix-turn-helix domain-containing protein n=1 Tax=Chitinimonas sp. TaxID=1934313 RepID=UPI002F923761
MTQAFNFSAPCLNVKPGNHVATPNITEKEQAILQLLSQGMQDKEIALSLGKSPQTIRNQLHTLYLKLGAKNRAHAVAISVASILVQISH